MENETKGLAREIASARLEAGRSLRKVAKDAQISAAYLQKLEQGRVQQPSPAILRRIAETLGPRYGRLMELAGYEQPTKRRMRSPLERRFSDAGLTGAEEKAVAAFIDHLLAQRRPI